MTTELPTRLKSEPLVEVICELRFESDDTSAVSLLPGIFFEKFGDFDQVNTYPMAELPAQLLNSQEALKYLPHVQLSKANSVIAIGPRVVSVAQTAPYAGWQDFSRHALEVFTLLKGRKFVKGVSRLSLRYTDIIDLGSNPSLTWLNASVKVGDRNEHEAVQLKVEHGDGPIRVITQIIGPATASDGRRGLVVDVDTILLMLDPATIWDEMAPQLDQLHATNKKVFFSILTKQTIDELGPEYS